MATMMRRKKRMMMMMGRRSREEVEECAYEIGFVEGASI